MKKTGYFLLVFLLFIKLNIYGQTITLVPMPDTNNFLQDSAFSEKIEYQGNFYFRYNDVNNRYRLAKFNGTSISLITNPTVLDQGDGVFESPIIYNGNLFFKYLSQNNIQLAKYDGATISLIGSLGVLGGSFFYKNPIVSNGSLYFPFIDSNNIYHLAKYDGNSLITINNPDNGQGYDGGFITYAGNKYVKYIDSSNKNRLALLNNLNFTLIPNPNGGNCTGDKLEVLNGYLFTAYQNAVYEQTVAKFDGTNLTLIDSQGLEGSFQGDFVLYNSNLYAQLRTFENKNILVKCNETGLSLITNPDNGQGINLELSIVYQNKLYLKYNDAANVGQVAKFDETTITMLNNYINFWNVLNRMPVINCDKMYWFGTNNFDNPPGQVLLQATDGSIGQAYSNGPSSNPSNIFDDFLFYITRINNTNNLVAFDCNNLAYTQINNPPYGGIGPVNFFLSTSLNQLLVDYSTNTFQIFPQRSLGYVNLNNSSLDTNHILKNSVFKIYPNPSNSIFNIEIDQNAIVEVSDLIGKQILSKNLSKGSNVVDLTIYSKGIYFAKVTYENDETKTIKLIKE